MLLVVMAVMRFRVERTQPRQRADRPLEQAPGAMRAEESLVVEADGQELGEQADRREPVEVQRTPAVDRGDGKSRRDLAPVAANIRLGADLHQGIGIVPGHRQDAARPVIFERSRE